MAELIDKAEENKINQLAMMYAVVLTKYGVDIQGKFETATQMTMALNEAYLRGRQDEIEKFRVLQSGYEAEIRASVIDEFAEKLKSKWIDAWDLNIFSGFKEFVDEIAEQLKGE